MGRGAPPPGVRPATPRAREAAVAGARSSPLRRIRLPIETPRLLLRLPSSRDVPGLRRIFRDPRAAMAAGAPLHSREERRDPSKMVARTRAEYRRAEHLSLSVIHRANGGCVGRVGLRGLDWPHRKVESLSYWIDPRYWREGLATEASYFLCRAAFRHLGLRRIGSQALDRNFASLRVLRRLGFVEEGLERQAVCVRGSCMDMVWFGLLKDELPPIRRLERYWKTTPAGHDGAGRD